MHRFAIVVTAAVALSIAVTVSARAQSLDSLPQTVRRVKPSIVGVGTFYPTRKTPGRLLGTGFVVGNGRHVLTNAHVYEAALKDKGRRHGKKRSEFTVVFVQGETPSYSHVTKVAEDRDHDVVLLELTAERLPALELGDDAAVEEGQLMAFTGFPIGAVLGLHAATHRGIVSAITPIVRPARTGKKLNAKMVERLEDAYDVFQLDAIAYPGNSGSPLYDPGTGEVYGIVSSGFVKSTKENALKDPSGITYAIPIRYGAALLEMAERKAR